MERYSYLGRKDAEALDEYRQSIGELVPSPAISEVLATFSQPTLADIKRKNQEEVEALRDEAHLKRFRILNYTSEDSQIHKTERSLKTFYCCVCGAHCLITDANLAELEKRNTDGSIALEEQKWFSKKYIVPADRFLLKRSFGVDVQYRFKCKDCGFTLGYRSVPASEDAKYTYFFARALVSEQSSASALQGLS
ncbi:hypothetical protein IE077_000945 [Cardiosporidium cionae]|uniref:STEEP1 domain-containing protein n=1 Tax=Cardiosporidium cionae TaxID=476202 RepID=A0ABQ7JDM8_9APIC|nr:hypothetical protein IE077_000945 [Cardiosporidium cionae]|eukprot:KAF8822132.1 hypothetical protein IE077_000945 [Cardiosporidium cionae]